MILNHNQRKSLWNLFKNSRQRKGTNPGGQTYCQFRRAIFPLPEQSKVAVVPFAGTILVIELNGHTHFQDDPVPDRAVVHAAGRARGNRQRGGDVSDKLVEKVARAISEVADQDPDALWIDGVSMWVGWKPEAKAAIRAVFDAIVEPSEAQINAIHSIHRPGWDVTWRTVWTTMIAALRKEIENG